MSINCTKCNLSDKCFNTFVDTKGSKNSPVMIIGEYPSYYDDKCSEVFAGDKGAKLNYYCSKSKLKRSNCYLTYALRCRVPSYITVKKCHTDACKDYLLKDILKIKPKVIILMGKIPVSVLLGETSVTEFRGHFRETEFTYNSKKGIKDFKTIVMPTFSINSSLKKWEYDDYIIHDFKKVNNYLKTGKLPKTPKYEFTVAKNLNQLKEIEERCNDSKILCTDYETTGLRFFKDKIINVGYCGEDYHSSIIYLNKYEDVHLKYKKWNKKDIEDAKEINSFIDQNKNKIGDVVKKINANESKKVLWNGKFDSKFALYNDIPIKNFKYDGIIAHALIDENKAHNLNSALEYEGFDFGAYDTRLWYYVGKSITNKKTYQFIPPSEICKYLAIDVAGLMYIWPKLKVKLKKIGLWNLFIKQQMPLVHLMTDLEYRGCKIDVNKLNDMSVNFTFLINEIENKVRNKTKIADLNLNSSKQLREYFECKKYPFEKLNVKKNESGYSVDKETLEKFSNTKKFCEIPSLILEHRVLAKLKNTYLDGKNNESGLLKFVDRKGMIHCDSNIHTPRTGRLSIKDPPLHNIPRINPKYPNINIRNLFITSKKNNVIWACDFKQIELRVAAYLSNDKVMINEINNDVDLHTRNCITFGHKLGFINNNIDEDKFNKIRNYKKPDNYNSLSESKKNKIDIILEKSKFYDAKRTFAKSLGFGLNYGIKAVTLAETHGIEVSDVEDMIDIYFKKYKNLYNYRERIKEECIKFGFLELPETKRKRRFNQMVNWLNSKAFKKNKSNADYEIDEIHRQAMNFPIQGYANELFVKGKLKLNKMLKKEKMESRILLSIHDGLVGEGPLTEMKKLKELCHSSLECVLGKGKYKVPLLIDFDLYDVWYGKEINLD